MKRKAGIILLSLAIIGGLISGCSTKDEKDSGFKNDKPVPAEDGGGSRS